ncbi:hypothetical protein ULF88_01785 [Halopseudomonas pachastrellae]|nr:hypothetical protein [Halopseudomonas pachastrellae]
MNKQVLALIASGLLLASARPWHKAAATLALAAAPAEPVAQPLAAALALAAELAQAARLVELPAVSAP